MDAKERSKRHFDDTAADYNNSSDGKFVWPMYEALVKEINKKGSGKLLDVGCGNGNLFGFLKDGRYELFGVDFSENMIAEAKKSYGNKASFFVADAEKLPFHSDSFDILVCNASFHHYTRPDTVLAEMGRVLKPGGKLLIGDPYMPAVFRQLMNVFTKYSDEGDYHYYGIKEMKKLFLENGLKWISSSKTGEHTVLHVAEK